MLVLFLFSSWGILRIKEEMLFLQLGSVTHECDYSYLGGRDLEDQGLRSLRQKAPISTNKLDVVAWACHPSYMGGKYKRTLVQA
jgi:hypothetical protein